MLEDFNADSPEWNLHCGETRHEIILEALIERHYLIFNNESGKAITPTGQYTTSIIHLTFTAQEIGMLISWIIDGKLNTPSDDEVIMCDLENLKEAVGGM